MITLLLTTYAFSAYVITILCAGDSPEVYSQAAITVCTELISHPSTPQFHSWKIYDYPGDPIYVFSTPGYSFSHMYTWPAPSGLSAQAQNLYDLGQLGTCIHVDYVPLAELLYPLYDPSITPDQLFEMMTEQLDNMRGDNAFTATKEEFFESWLSLFDPETIRAAKEQAANARPLSLAEELEKSIREDMARNTGHPWRLSEDGSAASSGTPNLGDSSATPGKDLECESPAPLSPLAKEFQAELQRQIAGDVSQRAIEASQKLMRELTLSEFGSSSNASSSTSVFPEFGSSSNASSSTSVFPESGSGAASSSTEPENPVKSELFELLQEDVQEICVREPSVTTEEILMQLIDYITEEFQTRHFQDLSLTREELLEQLVQELKTKYNVTVTVAELTDFLKYFRK